jgi:hypothetical protein
VDSHQLVVTLLIPIYIYELGLSMFIGTELDSKIAFSLMQTSLLILLPLHYFRQKPYLSS